MSVFSFNLSSLISRNCVLLCADIAHGVSVGKLTFNFVQFFEVNLGNFWFAASFATSTAADWIIRSMAFSLHCCHSVR